jgi:ABC-2 type transport system ATP-binding protein
MKFNVTHYYSILLYRREQAIQTFAVLAENVTKEYGKKEVLKKVNLKISKGEFYALMGPNGSGKTTLASILASVKSPTTGKIEIFGKKPEDAKKITGYVPQENFSSPLLTGKENLMYFAGLLGYSKREAAEIVEGLLKKVGLWEDANKRVSHYSGGMRKRLEVATILFPSLKLLILDEPTTGLDPSARRKFLGLVQELRNEETTILLVTHIGADADLASRVGLMDKGAIIAEDQPERLKKSSGLENVVNIETSIKNKKVAELLGKFSEKMKVLETETGYRVFTEDVEEATPKIVRSLDQIGCKAIRIETAKPSLEDVFFKLTETKVREVD